MIRLRQHLRTLVSFLIVPLPSVLKVVALRHLCGYQIARGVKIGLSVVDAGTGRIGARARIGHFNYIARMAEIEIGEDVSIGHCNLVLGGQSVTLGDGAVIGRFNEINSILAPLAAGRADPRLLIGRRAVITAWHKIDYTDRVTIGESVVFAGRLSNIWTHNRQQVKPVEIGRNSYVGSGIQMAPGSSIGNYCVVGMGSVVTSALTEEYKLVAGVPARTIKDLEGEDRRLVTFPTRPDLDGTAPLA